MTYSLDLRERVISHIEKGGSQAEAARLFSISYRTITYWRRSANLEPKKHGVRNRKIDKEELRLDVSKNPDALLRERAVVFKVHPSAISYALKRMNIVKKRA